MARKVVLVVLLIFAIIFMVAAEDIEEVAEESPWPENVVPGQFLVPVTRTLTLFGRFTSEDSFCTAWQCYIVTDEETAKWHEASGLAPYYEPVLLYELFAISPTDQWALYATGWDDAFTVGGNQMTTVPNADFDDQTPVIAIIDTGMRGTHEALQQAHYETENGQYGYVYDNNTKSYNDNVPIYDNDTHGTHVAGIIGGPASSIMDNRLGGSGMGKVRILPFNASVIEGGKVYVNGNAAIKAINKIINLKENGGVPIVAVNMSYGRDTYSISEHDAMKALYDAKIIAVVAAGNTYGGGLDLSRYPVYPASYNDLDNIITVAAVGNTGTIARPTTTFDWRYSNYGGATGIAAPGTAILSSIDNKTNPNSDAEYGLISGTSMATPFVAGALGAAYALYNDINGEPPTPQQLIHFLYNSAKSNSTLIGKTEEAREIDLLRLIRYVYNCTPATCDFDEYPKRPYNPESATPLSGGDGNSELFGCGCSLTGGGAKFNFFELAFAVMVFGAYKLLMRRRYMN